MSDDAPKCIQEKSEGDALLASLKEEKVQVEEAKKPLIPFYRDTSKSWYAYKPLKKEKPMHRLILEELSLGKSGVEVAKSLGVGEETVYRTKNQDWAQERVLEIQQSRREKVYAILDEGAEDAARLLVANIRNEKLDPKQRSKDANALLDRSFGCATTKIEAKYSPLEEMSIEDLQRIAQGQEVVKKN